MLHSGFTHPGPFLSPPPRSEVTKGLETLARLEQVETVREGIFVMPKERITILSTYS